MQDYADNIPHSIHDFARGNYALQAFDMIQSYHFSHGVYRLSFTRVGVE